MGVDGDDGDDDRQGDQGHGEQKIAADQRENETGAGDDLDEQEEEDRLRDEDGDAERDLLTTVWGKVECEKCQEADAQAGGDEVDAVRENKRARERAHPGMEEYSHNCTSYT